MDPIKIALSIPSMQSVLIMPFLSLWVVMRGYDAHAQEFAYFYPYSSVCEPFSACRNASSCVRGIARSDFRVSNINYFFSSLLSLLPVRL